MSPIFYLEEGKSTLVRGVVKTSIIIALFVSSSSYIFFFKLKSKSKLLHADSCVVLGICGVVSSILLADKK